MLRSACLFMFVAAAAACSATVDPAGESQASSANGAMSGAVSSHQVTPLGVPSGVGPGATVSYGTTSAPLVVNGGDYGWLQLNAAAGDEVTVSVRARNARQLPAAYVLDDSGKVEASSLSQSVQSGAVQLSLSIMVAGVYHVAVGEYLRRNAEFLVEVSGTGLYDCQTSSDCIAIPAASCCPHGEKVAINVDATERYTAVNVCQTPPLVCPHYIIDDERLPACNITTHQCIMVVSPGGPMPVPPPSETPATSTPDPSPPASNDPTAPKQ